MKSIFLEVQAKLAQLNIFKYIDRNWNQLNYDQPPVSWPCALIDITDVTFTQTSRGAQIADGYVDITLGNLCMVHTSNGSESKVKGYSIYDLMEEVNKALHGWHGESFDKMIRESASKISTTQGMEVYLVRYHITWMVSTQECSVGTVTDVAISTKTY